MATIGGRGVADVSYVPGALTAVVGDQCWALVEAAPDSPAVTRIWQQLGQGAAADALLIGLLTDGPPGGIPGFTLLVAGSGQHRLFCRGAVGATVVAAPVDGGDPRAGEGRAAPVRIDGTGLLTWRERVVDNMNRIFLGEPPADTALRLPATSGVLLAGCVIIDLTTVAARDTGSPALDRTKKNIVLYPDTITMTGGPGSLVGQAPAPPTAGSRPMPGDRGPVLSPAPSASFPPDPARPPGAARPPGSAGPPDPVGGPGRPDVPGSGAFPASADGRTAQDDEHDFLWGGLSRTVVDGAVGPVQYPGAPAPAPPPWSPVPEGAWPPVPEGAWPGGSWVGPPPTGPMRPPEPMPARAPGPPGGGMPPPAMFPGPPGGLIDAPPWLSGPGGPVPGGAAPAGPGPAEPSYPPPAPRAEPASGESGSTVKRGELSAHVAITIPPDRIGPVVPALLCPSGHVNPPSDAACRRCGAPLPHDPVPVLRPVLGVLRLSLGDVITLDRGVLMGRNPRTDFAGTDGEERPHVVKLPSAGGDISRTHLHVTLDGWHVLVTDLNSTNGTLVTLPGREPQQLRPSEPVPIQPGTVVTLADGIDFRYEVSQ